MQIARQFSFEAGHRLAKGYPNKCKNLHGHHYVVELVFEGDKLNGYDMVFDFGDIKPFEKLVRERLDHKMLLWAHDVEFVNLLEGRTDLWLMPDNPTAEHIAQVIAEWALSHDQVFEMYLVSVQVWETPKSYALYEVPRE